MNEIVAGLLALAAGGAGTAGGAALVAARRHPTPATCGVGIRPPPRWGVPAGTIRLATYNIHHGKGTDGRRDLRRVARHLEGADVVAIQEAARPFCGRGCDQVQRLGRLLGTGSLYLPGQARWGRSNYGNGLLSRLPVGDWHREPLHDTERRFRTLTVARIRTGTAELPVLITHVSKRADQEPQLRRIVAEFLRHETAVLMGDFNATRRHPLLADLIGGGGAQDAIARGLGGDDVAGRIDWILTRGLETRGGCFAPPGASDHRATGWTCDCRARPLTRRRRGLKCPRRTTQAVRRTTRA